METSPNVTINGKEYTIGKFNLGKQRDYAKLVGRMLKVLHYDLGEENIKTKEISIDEFVTEFPDISLHILCIALNQPLEVVESFDSDEADIALARIVELNPITDILKKLTTPFGSLTKQ